MDMSRISNINFVRIRLMFGLRLIVACLSVMSNVDPRPACSAEDETRALLSIYVLRPTERSITHRFYQAAHCEQSIIPLRYCFSSQQSPVRSGLDSKGIQTHGRTHGRSLQLPVSHYKIAPRKVSPCRQFTGKNPPRPAAGAQAGLILPVNCRPGRDFLGRFYNGETFYGAGNI